MGGIVKNKTTKRFQDKRFYKNRRWGKITWEDWGGFL